MIIDLVNRSENKNQLLTVIMLIILINKCILKQKYLKNDKHSKDIENEKNNFIHYYSCDLD